MAYSKVKVLRIWLSVGSGHPYVVWFSKHSSMPGWSLALLWEGSGGRGLRQQGGWEKCSAREAVLLGGHWAGAELKRTWHWSWARGMDRAWAATGRE